MSITMSTMFPKVPKDVHKKGKKSHKKPFRVKGTVKYQGTEYILIKTGKSDVLDAATPSQVAKHYPCDESCFDALSDQLDCSEVELVNDKSEKRIQKHLTKAKSEACTKAFQVFSRIGDLLESPDAAWKVVLLAILARVLDLALPYLPGTPAVYLNKIACVPRSLAVLLNLVNGVWLHEGKDWKLNRPDVLTPIIPVGSSAPSTHPATYAGGTLRLDWKDRDFWLPLSKLAVAVHPNLPTEVSTRLLLDQPLSIPIFCGSHFKSKTHTAISMDGSAFSTVDPHVLEAINEHINLIHAELEDFLLWLRAKPRRWVACLDARQALIPVIRHGRFEQQLSTSDVLIWTTALAVFQSFLAFATDKRGWINHEDANSLFSEVQHLILPESLPPQPQAFSSAATDQDLKLTADFFWSFLVNYLDEHKDQVAFIGKPSNPDTIAAIRSFDCAIWLVLPRKTTFCALLSKHPSLIVDTSVKGWDTQLQKKLDIPFKTEGDDPSWRYTFYSKNNAPEGEKCKLPCLGIQIEQIPDEVVKHLEKTFGTTFGTVDGDNFPVNMPEQE